MPINSYFVAVSLVLLRLLLRVVFVVRSHGFDCSSDSEQGTRARCKVYEMRSHTQPAALESDSVSERGPEAERERENSLSRSTRGANICSLRYTPQIQIRRCHVAARALAPLPLLLPLPCSLSVALSLLRRVLCIF